MHVQIQYTLWAAICGIQNQENKFGYLFQTLTDKIPLMRDKYPKKFSPPKRIQDFFMDRPI